MLRLNFNFMTSFVVKYIIVVYVDVSNFQLVKNNLPLNNVKLYYLFIWLKEKVDHSE